MLKPIHITLIPSNDGNAAQVIFELGDSKKSTEEVFSENGKHSALVHFNSSNIPIVYTVTTLSDSKASILMDWLEEATEACLGDQYGDDHFKANLLP